MIYIPTDIRQEVVRTYGRFYETLCRVPAEKLAADVLDEAKVHDQVALLYKTIGLESHGDIHGRRLLEVGSGFGIFLAVTQLEYGVDSIGLEPAGEGFRSTLYLGRKILEANNLDPDAMINAVGENVPYPDGAFDLVFSSTTLEHTQDPQQVLREAVRVLKPGGYLQFVFPNYGSVFEGHYAVPWVPYMNHRLARWWIRLLGRDPAYIDTVHFLTYFEVRRLVAGLEDVRQVTLGEDIFRARMLNLDIKDWAGTGRIIRWLQLANRLKLIPILTRALSATKSFEPFVLTLQKSRANL